MKAILGRKIGMTQVFDENGLIVPVTVVEAGPCIVVQRKTRTVDAKATNRSGRPRKADGYDSVQVGFGIVREKLLNKPQKGHLKAHDAPHLRYLREFRVEEGNPLKQGDVIKADIFEAGQRVDVIGVSKGKGFQGTMKRHRFGGGPRSHGSMTHRQPASSGSTDAARTLVGTRKPGHMGAVQVTALGVKIVRVDADKNLILIRGSVPGPNGTLVTVRAAAKSGK